MDLLTTWRAERVFAHGGAPYAVKAFLYPPSSLLLFRPLAALSSHELKVVGLAATVVVAWAAVMLSAEAIGLRWWGITSAVTILLLSFTQAMTGELGLENVTVLCFLALAAFFFLSIRDHWALGGVAIGLSLAIKPLLLPVLLVFLLARQWRGFAAAAGVPVALNLLALAFVANPSQVFSKLPSLLDRTGTGVALNSAWVDVIRTLALPVGVSWTLRVVTVAVVLVGTWWAWHVLDDRVFRIVTSSSLLLIGAYLAGTLSEYHFMLTLVPLAMTAVLPRSPIRTIGGAARHGLVDGSSDVAALGARRRDGRRQQLGVPGIRHVARPRFDRGSPRPAPTAPAQGVVVGLTTTAPPPRLGTLPDDSLEIALDVSQDELVGASLPASRWPFLFCLLGYAILVVLAYLPVGPLDTRQLPTAGGGNPAGSDPYQMVWFLAWVPYALSHGVALFHTNFLDYPTGINLADNTTVPLLGVLGWPITATLGPVATFNFLVRLAFVLSAGSMCFVLRRWCSTWWAPFLGGLLYAFGPYASSQALHLDLMFIPIPPLLLLCMDELVRRQKIRPAPARASDRPAPRGPVLHLTGHPERVPVAHAHRPVRARHPLPTPHCVALALHPQCRLPRRLRLCPARRIPDL